MAAKAKKALPWIALVLCFLFVCLFMDRKVDNQLDADMSSEMILADTLSEENALLSDEWFYSTELRVLNTQVVFMPLFKIFTNWHTIRVLGSAICYLILLLCYFYFCREAGIQKLFPVSAIFLLLPFSKSYFHFVIVGLYYIPHIAITFLTLGLVFQYLKSNKTGSKAALLILLGVLALVAGLGGPRQLLVLYLPLFVTAFLVFVIPFFKEPVEEQKMNLLVKKNGQERKFLVAGTLCALFSGIGYILNTKVLSSFFTFSDWSSISYRAFSWDTLVAIFNDFLSYFNFTDDGLFSFATVANFTCLLVVVLLVIFTVRGMKSRGKSPAYFTCSVFFAVSFGIFALLYLFTDMSYLNRYNVPILAFCIPVIAMGLYEGKWQEGYKKIVCIIGAAGIFLCCVVNARFYMDLDTSVEFQSIADLLVEEGYEDGYATFWNGNQLTELSNGTLDVRIWEDSSSLSVDQIYEWLQLKEHEEVLPEGKVFVITGRTDPGAVAFEEDLDPDRILYQSGKFKVYGYPSRDDLIEDTGIYRSSFQDNYLLTNGEDIDGIRHIYSGGNSFGPYISLYPGTYEVTVSGEDLDLAEFDATTDMGSTLLNLTDFHQTPSKVTYQLQIDSYTKDVEFHVWNNSDQEILVTSIEVEQVR